MKQIIIRGIKNKIKSLQRLKIKRRWDYSDYNWKKKNNVLKNQKSKSNKLQELNTFFKPKINDNHKNWNGRSKPGHACSPLYTTNIRLELRLLVVCNKA